MDYPSKEANALQAISMASAFSKFQNTSFFVPKIKTTPKELKRFYGINHDRLKIFSFFDKISINFFKKYFNYLVLLYLRFHPSWRKNDAKNILYVRNTKQLSFWGNIKNYTNYFDNWIFLFEAHDDIGLNVSSDKFDETLKNSEHIIGLLKNFNHVFCVTQHLADEINFITDKKIKTEVIRHASPIERKPFPSEFVAKKKSKMVLGYVGTIDKYRGVHTIIKALEFLPNNFQLRIVGRFKSEPGVDKNWFNDLLSQKNKE